MTVDHGLLYATELARLRHAFDRHDMRAVQLKQKLDAGINRLITEALLGGPPDEHGTSPAVPFATDNFCADKPEPATEKIGERQSRLAATNLPPDAVDID